MRGGNLHAWVEADLDGSGFAVLDPTPPSGVPAAASRGSLWSRLASLGREVEFFYDRRILGFESLDQQRFLEAAREKLSGVAGAASEWKGTLSLTAAKRGFAAAAAVLALAVLIREWRRRRRPLPAATRAYLTLRRLLAHRVGFVSPATAPAEVARRFAEALPAGDEDARAVVALYSVSTFGERELGAGEERELDERLRRLKKLA